MVTTLEQASLTTRSGRLSRNNHEPAHIFYRGAIRLCDAIITLTGRRRWYDRHKLPPTGGILIVSNHVSQFDALPFADFVCYSGRWPRFLGKIQLQRNKLIGWLFDATESIPVDRFSNHAANAIVPAQDAIRRGKAVAIYPEGTETWDPDLWPMTAKTGAARIALATDCPVIPVAQWGSQEIMPPHINKLRPFRKRFTYQAIVGDPIDLSEFAGAPLDHATLELATTRMMDALTGLVALLRGESAPEKRYDRRVGQRVEVVRTRTDT